MTSRFEAVFLRGMLPLYRYYHRIPGKKKKGRKRQDIELVYVDGLPVYVFKDDLPMVVGLPCFAGPSEIGHFDRSDAVVDMMFLYLQPKNKHASGLGAEVELSFERAPFARSLAKIAHCAVYERYRSEQFRPLLLDLVKGTEADYDRWIGTGEVSVETEFHSSIELTEVSHEDRTFIVVHIHLLATKGKAAHYWLPAAELC